ncbi:unnamed protein product [Rotaria sordida]|uniref:Uncharacterized protein n=1 Tax=Rotaria sordida TaxID=392033 RepID=A0A816B0D0_9BILA|nr:unnamed protein product [Rotaria sordida]CAF1604416.1 unnamed protein product [Rotaria sordida]
MASHVFNENSSFIHTFKHQISDLVVTISDTIRDKSMENLIIDIYSKIFALLTNLKCLDLDLDADDIYHFRRSLLWNLRSTTCFSSNIVHLRIKMHNFDDCLRLLNGRLSQLHTFIITLDFIYDTWHGTNRHSLKKINNLNTLFKLTCFSLCVYFSTNEFDSHVVPLLRRMSNLEKLTLSIRVGERNSFIDGTYLHNYVLSQMPHLQTFTFDIVTDIVRNNQQFKPSSDDIQGTFIEKGYHVDCYVDYDDITLDRCHVYSLPFNMKHIHDITHSFPGGMFMNVRVLHMFDHSHPFEHDLFARISCSFPLLRNLAVNNLTPQNENRSQQLVKSEETSSIIEYLHLVELNFSCGGTHIDYVEEFLCNLNTRLPCLSKLHVEYEHLVTVTENFTRNTTRMNCAKLKHIDFYHKRGIVRSESFDLYFPLLYHDNCK